MTKRDRLSFALRRLRTVKTQEDTALRIQKTHELLKEFIDELCKGTKNADLGEHTLQILDDLYAQNTGAIQDGRLPAPPMLPDCTEQINAQMQALLHIDADDEPTRRSETAAVLRNTLSLFALGPNEAPLQSFLDALDEQVKQANDRPTPITDYSEPLRRHTDTLSELDSIEDPEGVREAAVSTLCQALSVFAQGPNEEPVQTVLDKIGKTMKRARAMTPPVPDYTTRLQPHIDELKALVHHDEPEAIAEAESTAIRDILLTFAEGPNEEPIQAVLAALETLNKQKESEVPSLEAPHLEPHIEALMALDGLDDPDALTAAAAMALYEALTDMAEGPHETSIRALLEAFDKVTGAV